MRASATGRILVMAVVAIGWACASAAPTGPHDPEWYRTLEGDWMWVSASGGIAGTTINPASEGVDMRLVISEGREISLFRDDSLLVRTGFVFVPAGPDQDLIPARLEYEGVLLGQERQSVRSTDEGLALVDPCCDGFSWFWSRP